MFILKSDIKGIPTIKLGSSVKTIKKALTKVWEEELDPNFEECYDKSEIRKVKSFLKKEHKNIEEIKKDFDKKFYGYIYYIEEI
jgi:hypothetical protein